MLVFLNNEFCSLDSEIKSLLFIKQLSLQSYALIALATRNRSNH